MWMASLTIAYVPLPSVLPVRYYHNNVSGKHDLSNEDGRLTWHGTVEFEGMMAFDKYCSYDDPDSFIALPMYGVLDSCSIRGPSRVEDDGWESTGCGVDNGGVLVGASCPPAVKTGVGRCSSSEGPVSRD